VKTLNGSLRGKKIAILGYAFKKDTSDTRESQAAEVVRQLLPERPEEISIFDPQCQPHDIESELRCSFAHGNTPHVLKPEGVVRVSTSAEDACKNAQAVLILTEWTQFSYPPRPERHGLVESETLTTRNICPAQNDRKQSVMNLLERRAAVQDQLSKLQNTHPSIRPDPQNDVLGRFNPEPVCVRDCRECVVQREVGICASKNVDWKRISSIMAQPKWVFDGRGMVDVAGMESLGFNVEVIGRASTRSKLRLE